MSDKPRYSGCVFLTCIDVVPVLQEANLLCSLVAVLSFEKPKPPTLVSLCLGVVGKHFEDIIEDLAEISSNFPPDIKVNIFSLSFFFFFFKLLLLLLLLPYKIVAF